MGFPGVRDGRSDRGVDREERPALIGLVRFRLGCILEPPKSARLGERKMLPQFTLQRQEKLVGGRARFVANRETFDAQPFHRGIVRFLHDFELPQFEPLIRGCHDAPKNRRPPVI